MQCYSMTKHGRVRKLMAIQRSHRLADGRLVTLIRLDVKLGMVPMVLCKINGRLHSLPVNDPVIMELI